VQKLAMLLQLAGQCAVTLLGTYDSLMQKAPEQWHCNFLPA
jgi:hypothetical protein